MDYSRMIDEDGTDTSPQQEVPPQVAPYGQQVEAPHSQQMAAPQLQQVAAQQIQQPVIIISAPQSSIRMLSLFNANIALALGIAQVVIGVFAIMGGAALIGIWRWYAGVGSSSIGIWTGIIVSLNEICISQQN